MKILRGIRRVRGGFYRKHRQKRRHAYMEMHERITGTADAVCGKEKVFPVPGKARMLR